MPKELQKFADMLEQAVINLQKNNREAELEAETLYTFSLKLLAAHSLNILDGLRIKWEGWVSNYTQRLDRPKGWISDESHRT